MQPCRPILGLVGAEQGLSWACRGLSPPPCCSRVLLGDHGALLGMRVASLISVHPLPLEARSQGCLIMRQTPLPTSLAEAGLQRPGPLSADKGLSRAHPDSLEMGRKGLDEPQDSDAWETPTERVLTSLLAFIKVSGRSQQDPVPPFPTQRVFGVLLHIQREQEAPLLLTHLPFPIRAWELGWAQACRQPHSGGL